MLNSLRIMFLRTCPQSRLAGQIGEATSGNEDCDPIAWLSLSAQSLSAHIWPNTSRIEEYTSAKVVIPTAIPRKRYGPIGDSLGTPRTQITV